MASTLVRNPLATRPQPHGAGMSVSPCQSMLKKSPVFKRPLSPEPGVEAADHSVKRAKIAGQPVVESPSPALSRAEAKKERERRRDKEREEFKVKYTRAFPNWVFYFDLDPSNPERAHLEKRVAYMGARVDDFFSKDITHFITPREVDTKEKENTEKDGAKGAPGAATGVQQGTLLGSPIRLRGRALAGNGTAEPLVQKARTFNMKVWSAAKLDNILDRCDAPRVTSATGSLPARAQQISKERNLARLLETERLHGTTERDPTQRRHDYIYFSKESYFVLVEDLRQELATIVAVEYPINKSKDGKERGAWPVLHCHPRARGPFFEYDEREERRRQKAERSDKERRLEKARRKAQLKQRERKRRAQAQARILAAQQQHDLRRCASMNNLQRRATFPDPGMEGMVDLDADFGEGDHVESAHASGYLASAAYVAASGNSVGITSTTGTTSTAGAPFRTLQLPPALREKLQQQVTTSRRATIAAPIVHREAKDNAMGPPTTIPERVKFLRKSKSTNTLKLPKRDEASKPGYCECCRVKFEDFRQHIVSKKHRKFAMDDAHFANLDRVLARVRRRTVQEVEEENARFVEEALAEAREQAQVQALAMASEGEDSEALMQQIGYELTGDDVRWDEWVDSAKCDA
ncbi:Dfp1/Him1, central region-domain-containing protein [Trametes punicea]|nr:Dfp1/Him1, central region-domain-containing protein [Trametes punicea]